MAENKSDADKTSDKVEWTRIDRDLVEQACALIALAKQRKQSVITAESCTGGLIAALLSEAPGAGEWLHGGFVTYTKEQKTHALGVPAQLIEASGAVSEPVARAMAQGALDRSDAHVAVAVTGVAGPSPDEDGTPVGIVHFAAARRGGKTLHLRRAYGDIGRGPCRYAAAKDAMHLLADAIERDTA